MTLRPFCSTAAAVAMFDAWVLRLESQGCELNDADRYVVALLATREADLETVRRDLAAEADVKARLALLAAEDRLCRAFGAALDRAERTFSGRMAGEGEIELPQAAGEGRRMLRIVPTPAPSGGAAAQERMQKRILEALDGGVTLTKAALRSSVRGGQKEFLAALRLLVSNGCVKTSGRGRRNYPKTYLAQEA